LVRLHRAQFSIHTLPKGLVPVAVTKRPKHGTLPCPRMASSNGEGHHFEQGLRSTETPAGDWT